MTVEDSATLELAVRLPACDPVPADLHLRLKAFADEYFAGHNEWPAE